MSAAPGQDAVAVVGSATVDRVVREGGSRRQRGGVVVYAGLTFQALGCPTWAATNVALADRPMLKVLEKRGVHLLCGVSSTTTHFVNYVAGDVRQQEVPVVAAPIRAALLRRLPESIRHIHLGPLHPADIDSAGFEVLRERGVCVSLDLQGYVRAVEGGRVFPRVAGEWAEALACAAWVKASGEELAQVLAVCGGRPGALMERFGIAELVVTEGSRGGWVRDAQGAEVRFAARPVAHPGDPTGAGDVFFAAYLVHRLHRGENAAVAACRAAALAARQVAGEFIDKSLLSLGE